MSSCINDEESNVIGYGIIGYEKFFKPLNFCEMPDDLKNAIKKVNYNIKENQNEAERK